MEYTKEEQKAHRKLWIEALRSGNYKQGKSRLQTFDGFCCLGVACEVSDLGEWISNIYTVFTKDSHVVYDQSIFGLPKTVQHWLGLTNNGGTFEGYNSLIGLNDKKNFNFNQIADVIEAEPEGLIV